MRHLPCSLWPWSAPFWRWIPWQCIRTPTCTIGILIKTFFQGFARTCSQARWGTQQRCCYKQCRSSFSPLCSFGSSLAVPHIWVVEVIRVNISLIWKSPQLPGNPWVWVQTVANPQCQGNCACPSDAENHLFFLELLLTSINIVTKPSQTMIQVFHMRVQNWTLKYQESSHMEVNVEVDKNFEYDGDAAHLEQVLLVRDYVGLHGGRQAVHSLQVGAKWSWCGHGGKNTVAASSFQLARQTPILG